MGQGTLEVAAPPARSSLHLGAAAVALGLLFALICCLDPYIVYPIHLPYLDALKAYPFSLTALLFSLLAVGAALAVHAQRLWRARDMILVGVMLTAAQFMGLRISKFDPLEASLLLVLPVWLVATLANRRYPLVASPVLFFVLLSGLGAILSAVNAILVVFLFSMTADLMKVAVFFLLIQFLRTREAVRGAIWIFVGTAGFSAIAALVQEAIFFIYGIPLTLVVAGESGDLLKATPFGMMLRASAFAREPQNLSGYLLYALPMMMFLGTYPGYSRRARTWLWVLSVLTITAIFFALSMGAWATLGALLLLFPFARWPSRSFHILAALIVIGLAVYFTGVLEYVYTEVATSGMARGADDRKNLMILGTNEILRHPIAGVGLGSFPAVSENWKQLPVHNAYFQILSETGPLGAAGFCLAALWLTVHLGWMSSWSMTLDNKLYCKMLLLAMVAFLVNAMTEPTYHQPNTWLLFGFAEGVVLTARRTAAGGAS